MCISGWVGWHGSCTHRPSFSCRPAPTAYTGMRAIPHCHLATHRHHGIQDILLIH